MDDRNYLLMRAEQEEAKAARSTIEAVKRAHLELASVYRNTAMSLCPRWLPVDRAVDPVSANAPDPAQPEKP